MNNNLQNDSLQDTSASTRPAESNLCRSCCEFFGNPANDNLCSKCFKDTKKPMNVMAAKPLLTQPIMAEITQISVNQPEMITLEEKKEPEVAKQVNTSKCSKCKKKVGLLGYECKCGSTYCKVHRLPEDHDCEFDFCASEKEKLRKANPLISAAKLVKF